MKLPSILRIYDWVFFSFSGEYYATKFLQLAPIYRILNKYYSRLKLEKKESKKKTNEIEKKIK